MITQLELSTLFGGGAVLMSSLALGKLRLRQLVRYYGIASILLAFAMFVMRNDQGDRDYLYITVITTACLKGFLIPALLFYIPKKMHVSERLLASVSATTSYLLAAGALALALSAAIAVGPLFGAVSVESLFEAFAFLFIGVVMVMLRRDLISQIIGFLIFENGVSYLLVITMREVPIVAEIGILFTVLVSTYLMGVLSLRLKGLYAVENTDTVQPFLE